MKRRSSILFALLLVAAHLDPTRVVSCSTLLALLATAHHMTTGENDVRTAIDIDVRQMHSGETYLVQVEERNREPLLKLFNEHALLSAELKGDAILVKRKWGR